MKVVEITENPDKTINVKLCMCKGSKSNCKPEEKVCKTYKNKGTLDRFLKAFKIKK